MQKAFTSQSSVERLKEIKNNSNLNNSTLDNRVHNLHIKLLGYLGDVGYEIGYTYKVAKRFSDYDIISAAEYCSRKANHPGKAFVALFEKKIRI